MGGATLSLTLSSILIVLLLLIKHVELKRGSRFAENIRLRLDKSILRSLPYLKRTLPQLALLYLRRFAVSIVHAISAMLLHVLRFFESKMRGFHSIIKGKRDLEHRKKPSEFLNNVSEHKKAMIQERENRKNE